ncbi:MAG: hypothetical protein ACKOTZ_04015 [Chloroflexota bacterium]
MTPPGDRASVIAADISHAPTPVPSSARTDRRSLSPLGAVPDRRSARCPAGGAAAVARILSRAGARPDAWADPGLGDAIDRVRRQLLPIGSLAALSASWTREHAVHAAVSEGGRVTCEVRLAYAVRWLELTGAVDERPWSVLVGGSGR